MPFGFATTGGTALVRSSWCRSKTANARRKNAKTRVITRLGLSPECRCKDKKTSNPCLLSPPLTGSSPPRRTPSPSSRLTSC